MVKYSSPDLDLLFTALGEPTRRAVLLNLASGEKTLSALTEPLNITMPAVMKHLAVLELAGIVTSEKRGRIRYCQLRPERLSLAQDWISEMTEFWTNRLESLTKYLEEEE